MIGRKSSDEVDFGATKKVLNSFSSALLNFLDEDSASPDHQPDLDAPESVGIKKEQISSNSTDIDSSVASSNFSALNEEVSGEPAWFQPKSAGCGKKALNLAGHRTNWFKTDKDVSSNFMYSMKAERAIAIPRRSANPHASHSESQDPVHHAPQNGHPTILSRNSSNTDLDQKPAKDTLRRAF